MEYRTVICMNESDLHPYLVNDEISGVLLHASEVPKLQMPNTLVGYSACTETKGVIICSVKKMNPVSGSDEIYSIQNYDQLPLFEMLTKRYDNWRWKLKSLRIISNFFPFCTVIFKIYSYFNTWFLMALICKNCKKNLIINYK